MPRSLRSDTWNPMISVQNRVVRSMSLTVNTMWPSFCTLIGVSLGIVQSSLDCGPAILCLRPRPRQPPPGQCESRSWIAGYTAPRRDRRSGRTRVRSTADNLRRLTSAIIKAGGSAVSEADLVAEHLVRANLMGHDSHGVGMIPTYIRHLKAGLVVPNTRAKLV